MVNECLKKHLKNDADPYIQLGKDRFVTRGRREKISWTIVGQCHSHWRAQQLDMLATRLQSDLAVLALQGAQLAAQTNQQQTPQALTVGQALLVQLQQSKAVGRLVIDLDRVIAGEPGSDDDILLRGGDTLFVPKQRQEVTVIGQEFPWLVDGRC